MYVEQFQSPCSQYVKLQFLRSLCAILLALAAIECRGVELAVLSEGNWDEFPLAGKEVDRIYGDYVLRNDKIIAVIGRDVPTRNANMTVRNVGGCLIDLTLRDDPNDQLSAYYPLADRALRLEDVRVDGQRKSSTPDPGMTLRGKVVELAFRALPAGGEEGRLAPEARVVYRLADGEEALRVTTTYTNKTSGPVTLRLVDPIRVDGEFAAGVDETRNVFWAYDRFWRQAYGVSPTGPSPRIARSIGNEQRPRISYRESSERLRLAPNAEYVFSRYVFPAHDAVASKAIAARLAGARLEVVELSVRDAEGPVDAADIELKQGDVVYGLARTNEQGSVRLELPEGKYELTVRHQARGEVSRTIESGASRVEVELPRAGYLVGKVTDVESGQIACKVDLEGVEGVQQPRFGPDSAIYGVRNLIYTPDGTFRIAVRPGKYNVLISHGTEYDAAPKKITVIAGEETPLRAKLVRSVDTSGWISADFHSHSSPSGDNTSSQRGRVLNLLAEHIEFAPCTEHNRISSYVPHLRFFNAVSRMATCSGMELTGQPLPINHQNAFPLVYRPRTQDGGAPTTDVDPVVQIERLVMWDDGSEKLVQTNHPNIPQMFGDRDLDGTPDGGFRKMFGLMHVIEVHPPGEIFSRPESLPGPRGGSGNAIFHWMQLLNLGYRIPGVVNTDAHWNFHGSGWLRNYVRTAEDDPAKSDVMEMVRASKAGRLVMTNGPFLEVKAKHGKGSDVSVAEVGEEITAKDGAVDLSIRVQCPNWLDVNRVQVFVNGRPDGKANYTRRTHAAMFGDGVVKFEANVPLRLSSNAHVIVAAAGEGLALGRVVGPEQSQTMPVAVSNPIFVDVDGGGFQANGDTLDLPLPGQVETGRGDPQ